MKNFCPLFKIDDLKLAICTLSEGNELEQNYLFSRLPEEDKQKYIELLHSNEFENEVLTTTDDSSTPELIFCFHKGNAKTIIISSINKSFSNIPLKMMVKAFQEEVCSFLDCINVGVWITDENAISLALNKLSEETRDAGNPEDLLNVDMNDLKKKGYLGNSAAVKVAKDNREFRIAQIIGEVNKGTKYYTTGVPFFHNNKMQLIVCTDLNITQSSKWDSMFNKKSREIRLYENEVAIKSRQNYSTNDIIYTSEKMRLVIGLALQAAQMDTVISIYGESGTGKELFADLIHKNSSRKKEKIIKVNCGAIPESLMESELFGYVKGAFTGARDEGKVGLFELADKGTLFLDEISELPFKMQVKLLRVLQSNEIRRIGSEEDIKIDIRIITASNINLKKAVEEKYFREDLFYRLNVIPLEIPPLRERKEDIPALIEHFTKIQNKKYNINKKFDSGAISILSQYEWPGNVRELKNIVERYMVLSKENVITTSELEQEKIFNHDKNSAIIKKTEGMSLSERIEVFEKELLEQMLFNHDSANQIAKILKVNRSTITRKLKKYGITYGMLQDL